MSDEPVDAAGTSAVEAARRQHDRLIEAGNDVNVSTCRVTGEFFRQWGMPGARFEARAQPAAAAPSGVQLPGSPTEDQA